MSDPVFDPPVTNPFGLTHIDTFGISVYANPTFADIDGDGDLDAFVGGYYGNGFYRNTGTASNPIFASPNTNPFGLNTIGNSGDTNFSNPTFADIDGDGDLDAFVGGKEFYRNTGTASNPVFTSPDSNSFGLQDGKGGDAPTLVDIDGDGDLDAFVNINTFYRNTGTANNPAFASPSSNPFGLSDLSYSLTFADIDSDGDLDAFAGEIFGNTLFYRNIGTSSNPAFAKPIPNPFGLTNVGRYAHPTFADIDSDGDLDAFVGNAEGNTLFYLNVMNNAPSADLLKAVDLFKSQLSSEEQQLLGAEKAGMIRVMADFSKAAYYLEHVEQSENNVINDVSPNADNAINSLLLNQGWTPLNLSPVFLSATTTVAGQTITNSMFADGFYVNGNAAACVARCDDAVVISFRGTNDNGDNPNDVGNAIHPDADEWGSILDGSSGDMKDYYALLQPLIDSFDSYVSANGISKVYVTGHSLGGAMAIEYMALHSGNKYQAITFAAPAFTGSNAWRDGFADDSRITQIEVTEDPVPQTWDVGFPHNRPGDVIRFAGNNTLDEPDWHYTFFANDNNHSMDYYRQITKSVDADSWTKILAEKGDQTVLLGGSKWGGSFIVDGQLSGHNDLEGDVNSYFDEGNDTLTVPGYKVYYGGKGNDTLTGGNTSELMLGGVGDDLLNGGKGADRLCGGAGKDMLTGGSGKDKFLFTNALDSAIDTLRDVITDFVKGDKIDLSGIDANIRSKGNNAFATLSMGDFANPTFHKTSALYFDKVDHILFGNNDADPSADFSIFLTGVNTLSTADFVL